MKSDFIVIIPARYASSRFPGKPLAKIGGVEMIVRVCQRVSETGFPLAVATDDSRIAEVVERAGFRAVMTSPDHQSGTDRVYEAYRNLGSDARVIINVQGDEPFIDPSQIRLLADCFSEKKVRIATLARVFDKKKGFEALFDPNVVKLTRAYNGDALYFSRSIIPYVRGVEWKEWIEKARFLIHVGIYAYTADTLRWATGLPRSPLEIAESLEQLCWLENGCPVKVAITDSITVGIDTPADLEEAEKFLRDLSL